jgi:hypothetical protein
MIGWIDLVIFQGTRRATRRQHYIIFDSLRYTQRSDRDLARYFPSVYLSIHLELILTNRSFISTLLLCHQPYHHPYSFVH